MSLRALRGGRRSMQRGVYRPTFILVRPRVVALAPVEKSAIQDAISAWSGVIAGEIPVAGVIWHRSSQAFDGLIDDLDLAAPLAALWADQSRDFGGDFILSESVINQPHVIFIRSGGKESCALQSDSTSSRTASSPRARSKLIAASNAMKRPS